MEVMLCTAHTKKTTHTQTEVRYWSVHVSPVVGVLVPGEDICYSVSGPRSSFFEDAGVSRW